MLRHPTRIIAPLLLIAAMHAPRAIAGDVDTADYAAVLKAYVNDAGLVDYPGLKAHRAQLDAYVKSLGEIDPADFAKWPEHRRLATLINAYNAFTLTAIIDHYPIQSSFFKSLVYPKNSIRQIADVWSAPRYTLAHRRVALQQIEDDMLRKQFAEPRIHMAINCASMGCPPLRAEPYDAARLDDQLDDQARRFAANPAKFHIDRRGGEVSLSPIFKWFGGDFTKKYRPAAGFGSFDDQLKAVLNFESGYVDATDATYLKTGDYSTQWLDYDWSLNEQTK